MGAKASGDIVTVSSSSNHSYGAVLWSNGADVVKTWLPATGPAGGGGHSMGRVRRPARSALSRTGSSHSQATKAAWLAWFLMKLMVREIMLPIASISSEPQL